jgi:dUTP pyrophosphatase
MVEVKLKLLQEGVELPTYQTLQSAGADVRVKNVKIIYKGYKKVEDEVLESLNNQLKEKTYFQLRPFETCVIGTGLALAYLPEEYEIQVRPRSGISLKRNLRVTLGTIDADYRGEIGVILTNTNPYLAKVFLDERIAQLVINHVPKAKFTFSEEIIETERGEGGFGHTGTN